jgi:DNA mismatch repair protein MutL
MSRISILSESLINKIAAGEVIERPASIVRELVDNSIDAGSRNISIEVLYGGKKLIKVADDGSGMDRDDASLCFERHATSKIQSEDNLFNITTMGFRGEALSSIASVSKIVLVTSSENAASGTKIEFDADRNKRIIDAPPVRGTTVEIRDIFFNTPARKKFLKSNSTELSHIIETVTQKAFAFPEISFVLSHNNSEVLRVSSASGLKERFIQLYGDEFTGEFREINQFDHPGGITFYGFCSTPEFTRSSRSYQFIFINRRPVKNPTINHAVYSVYRELVPKDSHPAFFLFLDVDPKKVDVNVHPAKREVRFESSEDIHKIVSSGIRGTLYPVRNGQSPVPAEDRRRNYESFKFGKAAHEAVRETLESALKSANDLQTDIFTDNIVPSFHRFFNIKEAFVAQVIDDGLVLFDRHAVHERVLYERLLKKIPLEIENLVLPIRVELPPKEFNTIVHYREMFHEFGLDIDEFGANNLIVRALPREFRKDDIRGMLIDIASNILDKETLGIQEEPAKESLKKKIAASLACHKSVRGRESLNDAELNQLMADLEKTEVPDQCPHGRPTRIFLSLDDLMRMFKRK